MLRYKLRKLLIVLALGPPVLLSFGCRDHGGPSRSEQIRQGERNVEQHAKNIDDAANPAAANEKPSP